MENEVGLREKKMWQWANLAPCEWTPDRSTNDIYEEEKSLTIIFSLVGYLWLNDLLK